MGSIPLQTRLPKTYPIASIKKETQQVNTYTFNVSFGAKPGQFVMGWLPDVDEKPFSVALDDGQQIKLTIFAVGPLSTALSKLKVGDLVGLRGPFGTHYQWEKDQHLALVAGGYGAAPMYFVAQEALKNNCSLDIFVGARSATQLLYLDELGSLKNTTLHTATDDGSQGFKGFNVQQLTAWLDEGNKIDQIFACGPELMLKAVSDLAAAKKIPAQLSLERYMKCGYGLCGNCAVDPLGIRLCTDGPVVSNELCQKIAEFGTYHRDELGRKKEF